MVSPKSIAKINGERETRPRLYTPTLSSFVSPYGVLRSVLRLRLSALTGLVHASAARGITASLVSLCEAWLRAGTASYQHKRFIIVPGLLFYVMIPRAALACQRQKPLDCLQTDGQTSLITQSSASLPDSLRSMTAVSRPSMIQRVKQLVC